jgi:hypothetical protein
MDDFYSAIMDILPHEKIQASPAMEKISEDKILPDTVAERLPELLWVLESEYKADWEKIKNKQPIELVEKFGNNIIKLGSEYNIDLLKEYGESIKISVDAFDVESIKKNVSNFPGLLRKLHSYNKQKDE